MDETEKDAISSIPCPAQSVATMPGDSVDIPDGDQTSLGYG